MHRKKCRSANIGMGNVGSSAGGQQGLQPQPQQSIVWTDEEDKILREGLVLYRNYNAKKVYKKITVSLPGKSDEDVAQRLEDMIVSGTHKITESSTSHPHGTDKNTESSTSHPPPCHKGTMAKIQNEKQMNNCWTVLV